MTVGAGWCAGADYVLFASAIGPCGIAWRGDAVRAFQLPEASDAITAARLERAGARPCSAAPPAAVAAAIAAVQALLAGERHDLREIPLDETGLPGFHRRVYGVTRAIDPGRTATYGEIARELGDVTASRAVGQALGRNPYAVIVPCHRVLASDGAMGGFSGAGGLVTKRRLLLIEGARSTSGPDLFD